MPEQEVTLPETGEVIPVSMFEMSISRPPEVVLEEAKKAAKALKDVISKKEKPVIFNGEQYLEFEDWQTVGKFYGITVKVLSTTPVDFGGVFGFEARAVAIHVPTGREISAADAMCLNDEEKWSSRPKYEWQYVRKSTGKAAPGEPAKDDMVWEKGGDGKNRPKKERVLVGEDKVPLFQLRSMAQTRACAKAYRNVLAWVVVLAGYRPTPAEEMIDKGQPDKSAAAPQETPEKKTNGDKKQAGVAPKDPAAPISEPQKKMIFALLGKSTLSEESLKEHLGVDHIADIKMGEVNKALDFIRQYTAAADREPGQEG